jgi:hypothetical protein
LNAALRQGFQVIDAHRRKLSSTRHISEVGEKLSEIFATKIDTAVLFDRPDASDSRHDYSCPAHGNRISSNQIREEAFPGTSTNRRYSAAALPRCDDSDHVFGQIVADLLCAATIAPRLDFAGRP